MEFILFIPHTYGDCVACRYVFRSSESSQTRSFVEISFNGFINTFYFDELFDCSVTVEWCIKKAKNFIYRNKSLFGLSPNSVIL